MSDSGIPVVHIQSSVAFVVFKVSLGSFSALASNLISSDICAKFTCVIRTAVIKQSNKVHTSRVFSFIGKTNISHRRT